MTKGESAPPYRPQHGSDGARFSLKSLNPKSITLKSLDPRKFDVTKLTAGRKVPVGFIRGLLLSVLVANVLGSAALIIDWAAEQQSSTRAQATATRATPAPDTRTVPCVDLSPEQRSQNPNCNLLPIVTKPGELGPANTAGPFGGTDWVPAYPGSNVWIPAEQISGRLFVQLPGSDVPPPEGFVEIGKTPDGAVLFWKVTL